MLLAESDITGSTCGHRSSKRAGADLPVGSLLGAMISIQCGASLAKSLFPIFGSEGATALRLGLAAAILLIVFKPWRARLTRATSSWILIYGISLAAMNSLFYMAIRTLPLGVAVAIEFLGPLALAIGQSRRASDFAWALLAAGGLATLFLGEWSGASDISFAAAALALGAGASWAVYIVVGKRAAAAGRKAAVGYGTAVAALCTIPSGLAHSGWHLLSPEYLPIAFGVALLTSAIPYSLEMVALESLSTRVFGVLTSLEPAIAAISGFILLGETLSSTQAGGILCIVAASLGVVLGDRKGLKHAV